MNTGVFRIIFAASLPHLCSQRLGYTSKGVAKVLQRYFSKTLYKHWGFSKGAKDAELSLFTREALDGCCMMDKRKEAGIWPPTSVAVAKGPLTA